MDLADRWDQAAKARRKFHVVKPPISEMIKPLRPL